MDSNVETKSKEEILNELSNFSEPIESKPTLIIITGILFFIIGIIAIPYGLQELQFGFGRNRGGSIIIAFTGVIGEPFMVLIGFFRLYKNRKLKELEFEIDKRVK